MSDLPAQRSKGKPQLLWAAEIFRLVTGFVILAALSRFTGPHVLGVYLSITSIALLLPRLLDCGLSMAIGYFLRLDPGQAAMVGQGILRHVILIAPVSFLLAFGFRLFPFEEAAANSLAGTHWPQIGVLVLSEMAILLGLAAFIPTMRFKAYFGSVAIPPCVFLFVIGLLALSRVTPPTPGELVDLLTVSSVSGSAFLFLVLFRHSTCAPRSVTMRAYYRYGMHAYLSAIAKIVAQRFDRLFLTTVLGASGYAQYSLAVSIRDMATFPGNLYAMTLRNRQIDLTNRSNMLNDARRILIKVSVIWSVISITASLILLPLWDEIVHIAFGDRFFGAIHFVKIIIFSCSPIAIMSYAWNHLYALHRPGRVMILTCLSLALFVPIILFLVHLKGAADGVAIAIVLWSILTAVGSLAWAMTSKPRYPVSP